MMDVYVLLLFTRLNSHKHDVSRSIQDDGQPQVAHLRQGFHATGDLQEQKALDILSLLTKIWSIDIG